MKDVKIVIGSNFGDEGKGLMTRYFVTDAILKGEKPLVVFHNGTAQRGHTVDYTDTFRHVYHHFGSGTLDGAHTYFSESFWVHPMEFFREYKELASVGIIPKTFCDPNARVITPFDMLADHATEAWIEKVSGARENASCGFGSWCAIESRGKELVRPISQYGSYIENTDTIKYWLEEARKDCLAVLISRRVDIEQLPEYKEYFFNNEKIKNIIENFIFDLKFFLKHTELVAFNDMYKRHDSIIFENGQGLGLDQNISGKWHTTSNTGLTNPIALLNDKKDFNAEVCYVSRSYLTRHGVGYLEEETKKSNINEDMIDKTNVTNEFQGHLRYGYLDDKEQQSRINKDWNLVSNDNRYSKTMAITHCNEFPDIYQKAEYFSNDPFKIIKRN